MKSPCGRSFKVLSALICMLLLLFTTVLQYHQGGIIYKSQMKIDIFLGNKLEVTIQIYTNELPFTFCYHFINSHLSFKNFESKFDSSILQNHVCQDADADILTCFCFQHLLYESDHMTNCNWIKWMAS